MKYIVDFNEAGVFSGAYAFFGGIGVKDPQSMGGLWIAEMDGEQLVILILKYPKAVVYRPLKRE
jgi:hypothetical protein